MGLYVFYHRTVRQLKLDKVQILLSALYFIPQGISELYASVHSITANNNKIICMYISGSFQTPMPRGLWVAPRVAVYSYSILMLACYLGYACVGRLRRSSHACIAYSATASCLLRDPPPRRSLPIAFQAQVHSFTLVHGPLFASALQMLIYITSNMLVRPQQSFIVQFIFIVAADPN